MSRHQIKLLVAVVGTLYFWYVYVTGNRGDIAMKLHDKWWEMGRINDLSEEEKKWLRQRLLVP